MLTDFNREDDIEFACVKFFVEEIEWTETFQRRKKGMELASGLYAAKTDA